MHTATNHKANCKFLAAKNKDNVISYVRLGVI